MHPLNQAQPYPYNQWWMAAYGKEVGREILGRTILGERVILYRTEAGEPVALAGICPHRAFPLQDGALVGDAVQCRYHGFKYDKVGACVLMPSQDKVPAGIGIRKYPVVERGPAVWIWTGDPELASTDLLPDLASIGFDNPEWRVETRAPTELEARYTLLIDNLIDLSHITFIHHDTIPGGDAVVNLPCKIEETESSINVKRIGRSMPSNPLVKFYFPEHEGPLDQCFDAEYFGPCLTRTGGAFYKPGTDIEVGTMNFLHLITPITPTSVRYHIMFARNFSLNRPEFGPYTLNAGSRIQPQDIAVLEKIEVILQSSPGPLKEISCRADLGALRVRNRLETQIKGDAEAAARYLRPKQSIGLTPLK